MTLTKDDWKALFLEARKLIEEEVKLHAAGCGCRDEGDTVVEGPCPGVVENEEFLKKTAKLISQEKKATE